VDDKIAGVHNEHDQYTLQYMTQKTEENGYIENDTLQNIADKIHYKHSMKMC